MKLLYWTSLHWPDIGGIEVLAQETLAALQQRGYEITVIARFGSQDTPAYCEQDGIAIHRLPLSAPFATRDIREQKNIQRQIAAIKTAVAPDVVHLNLIGYNAFFYLRTRHIQPTPTLVAVHSDFAESRGGTDTILGQCLNAADWICAVSQATLQGVLPLTTLPHEQTSVIPNGLALPSLAPTELPFDPPHILCLGRVVHQKGFDVALRALALLAKSFPTLRLTIAGEGSARGELEALTAELGLEARVHFTDRLDRAQIPPLINNATVVVIPSRYREPFGLVALEAAHMARPVVATRWGGLIETVADGQSGILVENENPANFARAIAFLLDTPETAKVMGRNGYARAKELFSLEACVDAYDALYQRLAQPNSNTPG